MKLLRPVLAATVSSLLFSLAACGGGGATASDGAAHQAAGQAGQAEQGGFRNGDRGGRFPGASGLVADISGKTLQVQGADGQTAVTYSGTTAFTAQVAAKLADVKVGSCVRVSAPRDVAPSVAPSAGGADATPPTTIDAESVRITAAIDGDCAGGFGGGFGGGRPGGRPSDLPSRAPGELPSAAPTGAGDRGRFGGFGAFGPVTAVSGTGFTVAQQRFGANGDSAETTDIDVAVSSNTTYTTTKSATAAALAVGKCVSASGRADDTGAVTAERIAVSDAVDGECAGGFGAFPGRGTSARSSEQGTSR